jgi:hypothetical protein
MKKYKGGRPDAITGSALWGYKHLVEQLKRVYGNSFYKGAAMFVKRH